MLYASSGRKILLPGGSRVHGGRLRKVVQSKFCGYDMPSIGLSQLDPFRGAVVDRHQSISSFFKKTLNAPLRNARWSWGAVNLTTGQLFLRVWDDERDTIDGEPCILLQANEWGSSSPGRPEREHHVELIRNGIQAYGVVCSAEDISPTDHRTIQTFDTETLLKFGRLVGKDKGALVYAVINGEVPTRSARDRVRIPRGITADDVRAALKRLAAGEAHPFGVSTGWDVSYEGTRYPQKAVLGLAADRLAERPLGPYDFKAGECRRILTHLGFPPVPKLDPSDQRDEMDDSAENEIRQRTEINVTEKLELIKSRRGQGVYRKNLELFEKRCRVTGLADRAHLRASHIKPWCVCTDSEKLDGHNGLLLSPHVDHLFDAGYISFTDSGDLLVADALKTRVLQTWAIVLPCHVGTFLPEQSKYLTYHRRNVFRGCEE